MEDLRSREGVSVAMVSHDLNLACLCADRLLLMKEERVMSVGTPGEVVVFDTLENPAGCVLLVDENPPQECAPSDPRSQRVESGAVISCCRNDRRRG